MSSEFSEQLDTFLLSAWRNAWLGGEGWKVYVRDTKRYIDGELFDCLDIASVEVFKGDLHTFIRFVKEAGICAGKHGKRVLFIENVLNEELRPLFHRDGWIEHPDDLTPCYHKLLES